MESRAPAPRKVGEEWQSVNDVSTAVKTWANTTPIPAIFRPAAVKSVNAKHEPLTEKPLRSAVSEPRTMSLADTNPADPRSANAKEE
jgi:hypothetical protein